MRHLATRVPPLGRIEASCPRRQQASAPAVGRREAAEEPARPTAHVERLPGS